MALVFWLSKPLEEKAGFPALSISLFSNVASNVQF
jgi:hypothetical protein